MAGKLSEPLAVQAAAAIIRSTPEFGEAVQRRIASGEDWRVVATAEFMGLRHLKRDREPGLTPLGTED